MADQPAGARLIAGRYGVEQGQPLPGAGGGLPAYAATDLQAPAAGGGRARLMALAVQRDLAPRPATLEALAEPVEGLLGPLAHGIWAPQAGPEGYYVICPAPPGPSLAEALHPWPEAALIQFVLRPLARVLDQMASRGVTHRAIRPDNVFQAAPGHPVVLGAAWTAPPAARQPPAFEPVYSAMCLPGGRGEGTIADDVYALGVLLITLALGRMPLDGEDADAVVRLKLEQGSFGALAGSQRLTPLIADLARGMLAEDPEHRPPPSMLLDPQTARARRVAARPPRRAQRAIEFAGWEIWDCRSLAHAFARAPETAVQVLRGGLADRWLRRSLGDAALAGQVEEALRQRAAPGAAEDERLDMVLVLRAVALLDPLAPLCWDRISFWPAALGALLAESEGDPVLAGRLQAVVDTEAAVAWAALRQGRCDETAIRLAARQQRGWLRLRGACGGLARLRCALNPLLPCASDVLAGRCVVQPAALLPALERVAGEGAKRPDRPIDAGIAAFLAARAALQPEADLAGALERGPDGELKLLRVLATLQARYHPAPLPRLADWMATRLEPVVVTWRNRARRTELRAQLQIITRQGQMGAMLALLDDARARAADAEEARRAEAMRGALEATVAAVQGARAQRAELATRLGQEIAAAIGLAALVTALIAALGAGAWD